MPAPAPDESDWSRATTCSLAKQVCYSTGEEDWFGDYDEIVALFLRILDMFGLVPTIVGESGHDEMR
jgi:hypothetical protein